MSLAAFRVSLGALGRKSEIVINDVDVADHVTCVTVRAVVGQAPTLILEVPMMDSVFEGEGIVTVLLSDEGSIEEFLGGIEPSVLEAAVLQRGDFGTSSIHLALEILKEWASGRAPA